MSDIPEALRSALPKRYELRRVIGRGGMATVYLAEDVRHDRPVAVKVLNPELAASIAGDRFLQEIRFVARLMHPHVLALHDSGDADGFLYYVMPYVDDSLRARLEREGTLEPKAALEIACEVADALGYAHRNDIVHRDIKPENILLAEGHAVVADFGVARAISTAGGDKLTRTGFPIGTLGYMSPEQAAGRTDVDATTDIYSLACVFYEAVVGEVPGTWIAEEAGRVGRLIDAPPHHRDRLDRLPGFVEATLVRAMRLRPSERFLTAGEFAQALVDAFSGTRRYSEEEAQRIVQRAAELEARPTQDRSLSLGGIQQIAAEVGIPPEHVRAAAGQLEPVKSDVARGGFFGLTGKIELELMVAAEVSSQTRASILEEVRSTIGQAGRINETFDETLSWEFKPGVGEWTRRVQVSVSPQGGQTRIRIVQHPGEEEQLTMAVSVLGGIGLAVVAVNIVDLFVGIGIGGTVVTGAAVWTGQYVAFRAWMKRRVTKRFRVLSGLLERLSHFVAGSDATALPASEDQERGDRRTGA